MPHRIDPDDFLPEATLRQWQERLDARGLRATASPEHLDYVNDLACRMVEVGIQDVHAEQVPLLRWTPTLWRLEVLDEQGITVMRHTTFVAYSAPTGHDGVTGRLTLTPQPGAVGIATVPNPPLTAGVFDALDWDAPTPPVTDPTYDPTTPYQRVWLAHDLMKSVLTDHEDAQSAAVVLVLDVADEDIERGYWLYDGTHRTLPALFVGREAGKLLTRAAAAGASARVVLEAEVEDALSPNLVGIIPGASDDLVVLQSHTDGTNGIEDNGPEAILAMAAYLSSLPRHELPSSVLVLLTTGHFVVDQSWGLEAWLTAHRDDVVPHITAAVSLEHLGALPSRTDGRMADDHEFGCVFATPHRAVIDVMRDALHRAAVTEARVVRPFVPYPHGTSPDGTTWPGDGGPFWHTAGLPTANFITGPDYLLDTTPVLDRIDVAALRRQAIAFTEATLELATLTRDAISTPAQTVSA